MVAQANMICVGEWINSIPDCYPNTGIVLWSDAAEKTQKKKLVSHCF